MFIYGKTEEEHDRNLTNFLNRARKYGLKIGADKIQYKKTSIKFYGLLFMTDGHKATAKKIYDIQLMSNPKDVKQTTILPKNGEPPQKIQLKVSHDHITFPDI